MSHAKPYKLRSGEWGISTFDLEELERGSIVKIYTREGEYFVSIRNLVWMGKNEETGKDVAYYGISRIPDDGLCPICGTEIDTSDALDFGKPEYKEWHGDDDEEERPRKRTNGYRNGGGGQKPRGKSAPKQRAQAKSKPKQEEELNDDIPF